MDGEWKVEIDDVVLRIGPSSIHETVSGYVAAYNDGDCASCGSGISAPDDEARITLYQFPSDVQARQAAQRMACEEPVELASEVPDVPGIPADALGVGSKATRRRGRLVVEVQPFLGIGDLRDSARDLATQVQRL